MMFKRQKFQNSPFNSVFVGAAISFSLLFTMAFSCGDDGGGRNDVRKDDSIVTKNAPKKTSVRGGDGPTEEDVKAYVTEYESMLHPTGETTSEPESIDFTFGDITFGAPRQANTGDKVRKVESDYLYPVVVEYTIHQYFSDGDHPTEKKYNYELYRNAEGGWSAFSNGPAQ